MVDELPPSIPDGKIFQPEFIFSRIIEDPFL
jgi:hypothetical protein